MKLYQILQNYLLFPTKASVLPLKTKVFTCFKWYAPFPNKHPLQGIQVHENIGFCSKF